MARPDQLTQIIAFCSSRYNENSDTHPGWAKAYLAIMNRIKDLQWSNPDHERDLLDFLSKPHADPDLAKACTEVLEHIGGLL